MPSENPRSVDNTVQLCTLHKVVNLLNIRSAKISVEPDCTFKIKWKVRSKELFLHIINDNNIKYTELDDGHRSVTVYTFNELVVNISDISLPTKDKVA